MSGEINKVDTARLAAASGEIGSIRKNIASCTEQVNAVFRKLLDTNSGNAADELNGVAGQLKKSSADILNTLSHYETVLGELAGIYNSAEKKTAGEAGKLKFGGLR